MGHRVTCTVGVSGPTVLPFSGFPTGSCTEEGVSPVEPGRGGRHSDPRLKDDPALNSYERRCNSVPLNLINPFVP